MVVLPPPKKKRADTKANTKKKKKNLAHNIQYDNKLNAQAFPLYICLSITSKDYFFTSKPTTLFQGSPSYFKLMQGVKKGTPKKA